MGPQRSFLVLRAAILALATSFIGFASPPLKVGVGRIVPISYFDENGKAVGFAVDVLNEAARREQIPITWVRITKSLKDDLQSGAIDLLSAAMATEDRKQLFFVSEPWWSEELSLLSRAGMTHMKRLGVQQVYFEFARPYFDPATFVSETDVRKDSADIEARDVCKGTLDGALITHGELHDLFLNHPGECNGIRLESADTAITYGLSIISRLSDQAIARRLRQRIDDLILDGTLLKFAAAHPPIPTSGAVRMAADIRERAQNRLLKITASASMLFVALLAFFLWNRQVNLSTQKRLQQELRSAYECLTLKHEIARIGSYEWLPAENRVEWMAETEKILGIQTKDHRHTFEEWKKLLHPEDVSSTVAAIARATADRQDTVDLTYRIVRADGTIVWIHSRSRYSYDIQGKFRHATGVLMDVTDVKRGEMAQQILGGLMQVCSACRRIHSDDEWYSMEGYLRLHSGAKISHGMCPDCSKQWFAESLNTEGRK